MNHELQKGNEGLLLETTKDPYPINGKIAKHLEMYLLMMLYQVNFMMVFNE